MTKPSPAEFLSSAPAPVFNGNSAWASSYAKDLKKVIHDHAARAPRTLQQHLGPSELGSSCDRQVAGKMAGLPETNHVSDPWPSIRGTALHAWVADAFMADNTRTGRLRWIAEQRVTPRGFPDHPGTADLYDAVTRSVVDHKFLGVSSMQKLKADPPRHYIVQLLLYGEGYRMLGLPVDRVVLAAYPATAATLDGMWVWERPYTPADDELLTTVYEQTQRRKAWAEKIVAGQATLRDVPAKPSDSGCYFCLGGETEVVTRDGLRRIDELAGTTPELLIPASAAARQGGFKAVPVRALGQQKLYAVDLHRYLATKTIYATAEHRWIQPDGQVATTEDLTPGTRLGSVKARGLDSRAVKIDVAVAQGFVYGDGARGQGRRPSTLAVYGRSDKARMLEYFDRKAAEYDTPDGDSVQHIYGLPRFWKDLPPIEESRSFLVSWLAGYFAADGTVSATGQASISSSDIAALQFVRDVAAVCGVGYGTIRTKQRLGTGSVPTDLHTIDLNVRDLPEWFWHLPTHVERVRAKNEKTPRETFWSVAAVRETDRFEEVYCATVPDVEAFGLADGLMTGNCPFYRPEDPDATSTCPGHSNSW